MKNYLSKYRAYRFMVYHLASWLEYGYALAAGLSEAVSDARDQRRQTLQWLKDNDLKRIPENPSR